MNIASRSTQNEKGSNVKYFFKVFTRTGNSSVTDYHELPVPVSAKFIKFHPISQHIWNCLRVEIYSTNSTTGKNNLKKNRIYTISDLAVLSNLINYYLSSG